MRRIEADRLAREAAFEQWHMRLLSSDAPAKSLAAAFEHGWADEASGFSDFGRRHYSGLTRSAYMAGRVARRDEKAKNA